MPRQYVGCRFKDPAQGRVYTYHYDGGEPLAIGDRVEIGDRSGEGVQVIHVVEIGMQEPRFATKPINRKAPPRDEAYEQAKAKSAAAGAHLARGDTSSLDQPRGEAARDAYDRDLADDGGDDDVPTF